MTALLTEPAEQLLRQVHPTQLLGDGTVAKTAFLPSTDDADMLSTLRERVGADEAHRRWTEDLGNLSVGTWAVTVGEASGCDLPSIDDADLPASPEDHASIDFSAMPSKGRKIQAARKLRDLASARGCLHAGDSV